jgi:hypothetical protein
MHAAGETNLTLNDIKVLKYYGTYGKSVVVRMERGAYLGFTDITIAGITLHFENTNTPLVWQGGQFYELEDAYEQDMLSKASINRIAKIQNKDFKIY